MSNDWTDPSNVYLVVQADAEAAAKSYIKFLRERYETQRDYLDTLCEIPCEAFNV